MAEKLIPASIESMDQNLSSLLDKCKACDNQFPVHISLSRGSQLYGFIILIHIFQIENELFYVTFWFIFMQVLIWWLF